LQDRFASSAPGVSTESPSAQLSNDEEEPLCGGGNATLKASAIYEWDGKSLPLVTGNPAAGR